MILLSEQNYIWKLVGGVLALLFFIFIARSDLNEALSQDLVLAQFHDEFSGFAELESMIASDSKAAVGEDCLLVSKKHFGNWNKGYFGSWRKKRGLFKGKNLKTMLQDNHLSRARFERYIEMIENLNITSINYCKNVRSVNGMKSRIIFILKGFIKETNYCKHALVHSYNSQKWNESGHYHKNIVALDNGWYYLVSCPK